MRLWINAVEEWAVTNKKLTLSLLDIHQKFVSDTGIRPDKECARLVLSEMKRRSRLIPLTTLKKSNFWASSASQPLMNNQPDTKSWLSWSMTKFIYDPACWAMSTLIGGEDHTFSDLTDLSITDTMKFVSQKSLQVLSQNLLTELVRISKAERQFCFEWQHLLDFITPIITTIIDAPDGKELLETLEVLIEYLSVNRHIAIKLDNDTKLIKVANPEYSGDDGVKITQKDVATARLLRAKELLKNDADKYHKLSQKAQADAIERYRRKELATAKSLLRSHKRLLFCAEQKEAQLTNVEILLEQLENTDSNFTILQAYKEGADALKIANTNIETNTSILDEMYDTAAETRHLNEEMMQMLKDISVVSQGVTDASNADLEQELNQYLSEDNNPGLEGLDETNVLNQTVNNGGTKIDDFFELEERLNNLTVCQDAPIGHSKETVTKSKISLPLEKT